MDIVGKRLWFFIIAAVLLVVCVVSLVTTGLKTGVEFSSGSILTVGFNNPVDQEDLGSELGNLGYQGALIQRTGTGDYIIRTVELDEAAKDQILSGLTARFGDLQEKEFDNVSAMIASETARNAAIAVVIAAVAMLLYIAWAFRRMPNPFRFGVCAIVGLVLDALIALGVFSILGGILGWEINLMFMTGVLAVIGYSINNTVIVFDRIRENVKRGVSPDFAVVTNNSVVETLNRSINTSLTTLFTLFALALFVGASIQNFVVVLIIGVVSGVFNSTCVVPGLLVSWQKKEWGSLSGKSNEGMVAVKAKG
ncbi:MAG: protein translocase subunit SecF [Dehalococcoidales bacterium]|nr:protein translocase subunit SecF [Dehalococcoidales bacterium]